jgi:hypothetical protein
MDSLIRTAARTLEAGDPLGARNWVALRGDAPALALRGIALARLGDLVRAKVLMRSAARAFGPHFSGREVKIDLKHALLPVDRKSHIGDPGSTPFSVILRQFSGHFRGVPLAGARILRRSRRCLAGLWRAHPPAPARVHPNFRLVYANTMVTRSQQYACNRLNGTILVERSWTQKAEKTYDCQTKTRDPHGDLAPERIRNAFHRIIWQVYGDTSPLPTASRSA